MATKYTSTYKKMKLLDDRMDSYFLSETLKYLYLLFDEALPPDERESLFCHATSPSQSHFSKHPTTHTSNSNSNVMCALSELTERNSSGHFPNTFQQQVASDVDGFDSEPKSADVGHQCIDMQGVVFSTEGHVFLNTAELRYPEGTEGGSSSGLQDVASEAAVDERDGSGDYSYFTCPLSP